MRENPANTRTVQRDFARERGPISTADGQVVAISIDVAGPLERQRVYPEGDLYAHTVGYLSFNLGAEGVERAYNDDLVGTIPALQLNDFGSIFGGEQPIGEVVLTLRHDLQSQARALLGERKGSVVALDPRTGAILALWSWPSFDPNVLAGLDGVCRQRRLRRSGGRRRQSASSQGLPRHLLPGIDVQGRDGGRGARQRGCHAGQSRVRTVQCLSAAAHQSAPHQFRREHLRWQPARAARRVVQHRIRRAGSRVDRTEPHDRHGPRLRLRVGSPPRHRPAPWPAGSRPTSEPSSRLPTPEVPAGVYENTPALAQASIGQNDVSATPLQMALVAAAIANNGEIMEPHVVSQVKDRRGSVV